MNLIDYSPFGVQLSGRSFTASGADKFRYGYQGSEMDNEVKGDGNSYTTEFRQLDPRLGRWLTTDPKMSAWESPYASMGNSPIWHNDPMGDTLKSDGSVQAGIDLKSLGGKYSEIVDVSNPNDIKINFDLVKDKFTNTEDFEKYKAEASSFEGIKLIQDISGIEENIYYSTGYSAHFYGHDAFGNLVHSSYSNYELKSGKIIVQGLSTTGVQNLSTTPYDKSGQIEEPDYPNIQGFVQIVPGIFYLTTGIRYEDHKHQLIPRASIVYHELEENYLRTHEKQYYETAHPGSKQAEGSAYGNPTKGTKNTGIYGDFTTQLYFFRW